MSSTESLELIQDRLDALVAEVDQIKERNDRVDRNKMWETSRTRLFSVTAIMYVTMVLLFYVLDSGKPLLDAVIPTTGYMLSTFSLRFIKSIWEKR